jgi:uncharacterized protein DUF805
MIPIIVSSIAVAIKRLHDRNKSGWWLLVFYFLPGVIGNIGPYTGVDIMFQLASLGLSIWALSSSASCAERPGATSMDWTRWRRRPACGSEAVIAFRDARFSFFPDAVSRWVSDQA